MLRFDSVELDLNSMVTCYRQEIGEAWNGEEEVISRIAEQPRDSQQRPASSGTDVDILGGDLEGFNRIPD